MVETLRVWVHLLCKNTVDFIAIAETKLDQSFPNAQFKVQNYELYRSDFTARSGGLLVHIRDDLPHRRLNGAELNGDGFESICIKRLSNSVYVC